MHEPNNHDRALKKDELKGDGPTRKRSDKKRRNLAMLYGTAIKRNGKQRPAHRGPTIQSPHIAVKGYQIHFVMMVLALTFVLPFLDGLAFWCQ
jgi:hypothetical protein